MFGDIWVGNRPKRIDLDDLRMFELGVVTEKVGAFIKPGMLIGIVIAAGPASRNHGWKPGHIATIYDWQLMKKEER